NSSDGGSTWETPLQIDDNLGRAHQSTIAIDSSDDLHVIWQGRNATHNQDQAVYRKYDGSWGTVAYLTDSTNIAHVQTTIATDLKGPNIYAIWTDDNGDASNHQIVMRKSEDQGSTWGSETQLIDRTESSRIPIALHYNYPENCGNIPYQGVMFAFTEDWGGTPSRDIYYSSDWDLLEEGKLFLFSYEYPTNLSFSIFQPLCNVDVNISIGGNFNVSFWENSTGSWIQRQTNNTVSNGTFWWQFTQVTSYETVYYWRVQANNLTVSENITYRFTSLYLVNETGDTITHCDLFTYVDGKIVAKHDYKNDTANYTLLSPAYRESAGWIADGGGTIILHNDTWYVTHRQRTGDTDRANYFRLDKSTNLVDWTIVWNVTKGDIGPITLQSFERFSIRYHNNSWYLYFGEDHDGTFDTNYIKASSPEELEYSLLNSNNWTLIVDGAKDPEVHYHNGTYYVTTTLGLYKDDNPEFTSPTFIVDFTQLYKDKWGGGPMNPGYNTGTIMFDNSSGYFMYWRTVTVDFDDDSNIDDFLWFFATSGDLENWEATDRHVNIKNWTVDDAALLTFPAYFVTENETVIVMDWKDASNNRGYYLWVYDEPVSNYDPVFSNETPTNETIGIGSQPWCSIQVNDTDNDTMTINFYENSTGSWIHRQTNNSVVESPDWSNNGTYWWQFTQASIQSTQYWWNVTADDGTTNISVTYTFTTNEASVQSDPGPVN
ncbi:MAG: hypothetical protein KAX31_02890, partial [Thermoplasmata archaeon]|nr:hypothetical protein [Thermoplasmata archaeon]